MCGMPMVEQANSTDDAAKYILDVDEVRELTKIPKEEFDKLEKWKQATLEAWWVAHCTCMPDTLQCPRPDKEGEK